MRQHNRWLRLFAVLVGVSLVAAACGDDDDSETGGDTTETTAEEGGGESAAPPIGEAAPMRSGQKPVNCWPGGCEPSGAKKPPSGGCWLAKPCPMPGSGGGNA